jgi:hypothetical protein
MKSVFESKVFTEEQKNESETENRLFALRGYFNRETVDQNLSEFDSISLTVITMKIKKMMKISGESSPSLKISKYFKYKYLRVRLVKVYNYLTQPDFLVLQIH